MQETRKYIIEILKTRENATVDELVEVLQTLRGEITAVTVRHHLARLQAEGFVCAPQMRHRSKPGRPQHTYKLTNQALGFFPNSYRQLAHSLLNQLQIQLPAESVNVILEGVADNMANEAHIFHVSISERLDEVTAYLNQLGYKASWETTVDGYILHTHNCPYYELVISPDSLCNMDTRFISRMLGVVPRLISHIAAGDTSCSYFIPGN